MQNEDFNCFDNSWNNANVYECNFFFATSEVVQLAVGTGIQSLLADTLSLSVVFSILSIIVARLISNKSEGN